MAFTPEELIFAPTGQCNLKCAHCRVSRPRETLRISDAIALMESCRPHGIDRIGFSGGEPFLEPDFLCAVSEVAVRLDFVFDRLMTNAVWYRDKAHLRAVLSRLFEAGFDGIFGVSVDSYHGQETDRLVAFFEAVFDIWGRKDCVEITWVDSPDDAPLFAKFRELARDLGGELVMEEGLPALIADPDGLGLGDGADPDGLGLGDGADPDGFGVGDGADPDGLGLGDGADPDGFGLGDGADPDGFGVGDGTDPGDVDDEGYDDPGFDDREALSVCFVRIPYSPPAGDSRWDDGGWFEDDFCRGPGNVFYVHPDGRIAVCCGFANENPELVAGQLGIDDYESLMRSASVNPHIAACYSVGLASTRKLLEQKGLRFPGKVADPCVFCDHLCKMGLTGR